MPRATGSRPSSTAGNRRDAVRIPPCTVCHREDPQGFTDLADPPALGIALDPVYVDAASAVRARTWRPHFSVVARVRSLERFAPLEGGATDNGGFHPGVEAAPGDEQVLFGVHVVKLPLAFHMTYYRFLDDKRFSEAPGGAIDWVSFSFERRFGR